MRGATAALLALGVLFGSATDGEARSADDPPVLEGEAAQALRCAAYIGMAAQHGLNAGLLSAQDRLVMATWSMQVLERWVPLAPEQRLATYGEMIEKLDDPLEVDRLVGRHGAWCLQTFDPERPA